MITTAIILGLTLVVVALFRTKRCFELHMSKLPNRVEVVSELNLLGRAIDSAELHCGDIYENGELDWRGKCKFTACQFWVSPNRIYAFCKEHSKTCSCQYPPDAEECTKQEARDYIRVQGVMAS